MDSNTLPTQPNTSTQTINHNAISNNVANIINACVKHPLQAYTEFIIKQQALKKVNNITMLVDTEPTTSPQLLHSLVHKEVLKELNKLQSTLINRPKNIKRGANANTNSIHTSNLDKGASLKKKSNQQRTQTPTRRNCSHTNQTTKTVAQQHNSSSKKSKNSAKTTKQSTVNNRDNVGKRDNSKKTLK
jgi:hypothetical protein